MDDGLRFASEYANATTLHPVGLAMLLLACVMTFVVPRRWMIAPTLALACFVPPGQRIVLASLDFTFLRVIALVAIAAAFARGKNREFRWKMLDTVVVGWVTLSVLMPVVRDALPHFHSIENVAPSVNAMRLGFIYYLGIGLDSMAAYFAVRLLVSDWGDATRMAITLLVLSVPVAAAFIVEWVTQHNMFAVFGGVPELTVTRSGRLRCQGAFAHPILAGCFWASVLPMVAALGAHAGWRTVSIIGFACTSLIIVACASSTPIIATVVGLFGLLLYQYRQHVFTGFLAVVTLAVGAHLVMDKPIWHLFARFPIVAGSTGYHRYRLIDSAVNRMDEWWLAGSALGTEHWGRGLFDVTNFYVAQGLQGGLLLLLGFLMVIGFSLRSVGQVCRQVDLPPARRLLAWSLGVCVVQHAVSLTAVSYFGQIWTLWFATLGVIGSLALTASQVAQQAHDRAFAHDDAQDDADAELDAPDPRELVASY